MIKHALRFARSLDYMSRSSRRELLSVLGCWAAISAVFWPAIFWVTYRIETEVFLMPLGLIMVLLTFMTVLFSLLRRLHDTNRSAVWLLAAAVPPVLLVVLMLPGHKTANRYGRPLVRGIGVVEPWKNF